MSHDIEDALSSLHTNMRVAYALRDPLAREFLLEVKSDSTDLQVDPDSDPVANLLEIVLESSNMELSISSLRELDKIRRLSSQYFNTMIQMIDLSNK